MTHGRSRLRTRSSTRARGPRGSCSRNRISLSPKISTRPVRRYSSKPASARPVFWICGSVMRRSSPAAPASRSRSSPREAARSPSRSPPSRLRPAGRSWADLSRLIRLDKPEVAVRPAIDDADRVVVATCGRRGTAPTRHRRASPRPRPTWLDRVAPGLDDAPRRTGLGRSSRRAQQDVARRPARLRPFQPFSVCACWLDLVDGWRIDAGQRIAVAGRRAACGRRARAP